MSIDFTKPIQLKKPAKHGDRVTFEDYSGNMSLIEQYLNAYIKSGIKVFDATEFINFFKLQIQDEPGVSRDYAILPTIGKVISLFNELYGINTEVKTLYESDYDFSGLVPSADDLNSRYFGDDGLEVTEIATGDAYLLISNPKTITERAMEPGAGVLYSVPTTGAYEVAVFTNGKWHIDNTKDQVNRQLASIQQTLNGLDSKIVAAEGSIRDINNKISDQGNFVLQTNLKDISGRGSLALTEALTDPHKIPTRAEVRAMGLGLSTRIMQADNEIDSTNSRLDNVSDKANSALTKATDADSKASSVSGIAATASQDAHDAKIAAAKASDDLVIEVAARKAEDLVLDGKIASNTTAISTNTQTINANKAILDTVKEQADSDHRDLATNIKPALASTTHIANEALAYGQDWNTSKGDVAMKSELEVKATIDMKGRPITKVGTNSYKIDFGTWNGSPALDLSGISNGVKAIINIHRTTQTDPVQNRYNDLIDQHYNDATSDGTCTIYLADSLSTLEKTQYTATVIVSATQATFSLNKADGTAANLNAAQEAVVLAYQAVSISFEGSNTQTISAGDDVARGQITALTQTVQTLTGAVGGKQDALTVAQLAVVDGVPFTAGMKGKFTSLASVGVQVTSTTNDVLPNLMPNQLLTTKDYVDSTVSYAMNSVSPTGLSQLKGIKVQKNGADLSTSQTTLSSLTSSDLLVDKTYADAIVAGKQNSTLATAIGGATTVVGALTAINSSFGQMATLVASINSSVNGKQNATDNSLTTTSKNIAGAINEIDGKIAIIDISNLTTQDAIFAAVSIGKQYFMAVDSNKQYLMQGLCISKSATTATFIGYSWNTSSGHTNTVKATAVKGTTSGDYLNFMGIPASEILADDNAITNTSSVKSLLGSYSTTSEVDAKLAGYVDREALDNKLTNYTLRDFSNIERQSYKDALVNIGFVTITDLSEVLNNSNVFTELSKLKEGDMFITGEGAEIFAGHKGVGTIIRKEATAIFYQHSGTVVNDAFSTNIVGVWVVGNDNRVLASNKIDIEKTASVIQALSGSTIAFKDGTTLVL